MDCQVIDPLAFENTNQQQQHKQTRCVQQQGRSGAVGEKGLCQNQDQANQPKAQNNNDGNGF